MGDLFDSLAARALGAAPTVRPLLAPRLGPPVRSEGLIEVDAGEPSAPAGRRAVDGTGRTDLPGAEPSPRPVTPAGIRDRDGDALTLQPAVPLPGAPTRRAVVAARVGPGDDPQLHRAVLVPQPAPRPPTDAVRPRPAEQQGPPGAATPVAAERRPPHDLVQPEAPWRIDPLPARPAAAPVEPDRSAGHGTADETGDGVAAQAREAPVAPVQVIVTIGRVEISVPAPSTPVRSVQPRWPEPRLSLHDYLRLDGRR